MVLQVGKLQVLVKQTLLRRGRETGFHTTPPLRPPGGFGSNSRGFHTTPPLRHAGRNGTGSTGFHGTSPLRPKGSSEGSAVGFHTAPPMRQPVGSNSSKAGFHTTAALRQQGGLITAMVEKKAAGKDPKTSCKACAQLVAGAVGGATATSIIYPLDTVKVKLQTFPHLYTRGLHCLQETLSKESLTGLYRGIAPAVIVSTFERSVVFMAYGVCQDGGKQVAGVHRTEDMTVMQNAQAGGLAGLMASLVVCPLDLIKCRLQGMQELSLNIAGTATDRAGYAASRLRLNIGPRTLVQEILRTEGLGGLFHGYTATLWKLVPGNMVYFGSYELARSLLKKPGQTKNDIGVSKLLLSGGLAGMAFWGSIYPFDLVKSRVQVMAGHGKVNAGFWKSLTRICQKEGVKIMYSGLSFTLARAFLANAICFSIYEKIRGELLAD